MPQEKVFFAVHSTDRRGDVNKMFTKKLTVEGGGGSTRALVVYVWSNICIGLYNMLISLNKIEKKISGLV